jgi:recombination protein RecT
MNDKLTTTKQAPDVNSLLVSQNKQIMAALPRHLSPERFTRIALTELRKNPKLGECDPLSFLGAVIQAAQLGLEPGSGLGHAYLIPFFNGRTKTQEVQFIPGYRGLVDLARRSGKLKSISARVVREKDTFEYEYGDNERIYHKPSIDENAGEIIYVYAVAHLNDGGIQREVMNIAQIEKIRDRKKMANPVWDTDFEEMARKTVIRRIAKYLPLSPEMVTTIDMDDTAYKGESQENWRIIDENYRPEKVKVNPEKNLSLTTNGVESEAITKNGKDDRALALAEFDDEINAALSHALNPETILGKKIPAMRETMTAAQLYASVDILREKRIL